MNINKFDMFILIVTSIAVITMSFTFPALGLSGNQQNESDIPEFNITKGAADFAREEPKYPGTPSEGTLHYINGSESWEDNRQVYLERGNTEYLLSFFDDNSGGSTPVWHANLIKFNSSGSYTNDVNINESEAKELCSVDSAYCVGLNNLNVINNSTGNEEAELDWEVTTQPSDQNWLGRLPVVGSIISGANQLASIVGWGISIIWHYVVYVMTVIANVLLIFYNIITFVITFIAWLTTTYGNIVSGAPAAWVSVIVAIPGILLSLVFMKLIAVGIHLLPLT